MLVDFHAGLPPTNSIVLPHDANRPSDVLRILRVMCEHRIEMNEKGGMDLNKIVYWRVTHETLVLTKFPEASTKRPKAKIEIFGNQVEKGEHWWIEFFIA